MSIYPCGYIKRSPIGYGGLPAFIIQARGHEARVFKL